jgi:hypothetical protein
MKLRFLASIFFTLAFAFWPLTVVHADPNGLKVEVYTFDPSVLPDRQPYTLCETALTSVADINFDVGGDVVADCQADFVVIHYSGFLTFDRTGSIAISSQADDGFYLMLDDLTVIDDWTLKGCSGSTTVVDVVAGVSMKLDAWWFEYGGGACNILLADGQVIPASSYSQNVVELPVVDPVIPDPTPTIPVILATITPEPPVVVPVDPEPPVIVPVTPVEPVIVPEPIPAPQPTVEPVVEPLEPVLTPAEEYQAVLDNLMHEAQADDMQVPENIANIPLLGDTAVALINALNFVGNVGADMSPAVRKKAKQTLVSAVIVTQIAQLSTQTAMSAASASIASSSPKQRKIDK